jgi:hypothetical protein
MIIKWASWACGETQNAIVVVTTFVKAPQAKPIRSEAGSPGARKREGLRSWGGRAPLMTSSF